MNRADFLKQFSIASFTTFAALSSHKLFAFDGSNQEDQELIKRLVVANDAHVEQLLRVGDKANRHGNRSLGYNFAKLSAAYCHPNSQYFKNEKLIAKLSEYCQRLKALQQPDGTLNSGNLESPPDTSFVMEPLCAGVYLLSQCKDNSLNDLKTEIKTFILKVGEALLVGGVHTPNHRWELCAALAWIYTLYPHQDYLNRINDWLDEGVFIDEDGFYPERSMNYAEVENRALLTIGRLTNQSILYSAVAKNLAQTYFLMHANGDLVTVNSRRQDQYSSRRMTSLYVHYRYLANYTDNPEFAYITNLIETFPDFEEIIVKDALYLFMVNPVLARSLPKTKPLPTTFSKYFPSSALVHSRRENKTFTIFGGTDWPLIIASGRSVNPNFFSFRKGNAILKHIRMSSQFFSMGHFRSEGLIKNGNKYLLQSKQEAVYYQPLPKEKRNKVGDYVLGESTDKRFHSKMDFENRPVSNVKTLQNKIEIQEQGDQIVLHFSVIGLVGVPVTIELCFDALGELNGVEKIENKENEFLFAQNQGTYSYAGDTITFGPGMAKHQVISNLDGEKYSVHFGQFPAEGKRVFITGFTPFEYSLSLS